VTKGNYQVRAERTLIGVLLALYAGAAAILLYSPFCMFTRLKMQINDYGTYTNALWNTAHGEWFRYLMDLSYLRTHLSLTLALVAPLFHVWDHPFLLAVVQWSCGVGGSLWMAWLAHRRQLSRVEVVTFLFFFLAYASMQSVLLCDFHGVCLYFVLFPWLYLELTRQRLLALAPLALILGLREDAALLVVPMILYFAVARRWRTGYVLAGLALLYTVVAVQWLFPWVNSVSLWERRADLVDGEKVVGELLRTGLENRLVALFWLFLPAFPLLTRRDALPIVLFPLAALAIVMSSAHPYNYSLDKQYPAPAFTLMVLGMIETLGARRASAPPAAAPSLRLPLYLVAVTLVAHFGMGQLPIGQRNRTRALMMPPSPAGLGALQVANRLPKEGVLLTTSRLCGTCSNRRDLLCWGRMNDGEDRMDLVFFDCGTLFADEGSNWMARVRSGEFGATYFDQHLAILARGAKSEITEEVLSAYDNLGRTVVFPRTRSHQGTTAFTRSGIPTRYWHGNGSKAPANLSHGSSVTLPPGRYAARFRLRALPPARAVRGHWGFFELFAAGQPQPLATGLVAQKAPGAEEFTWQSLDFTLPKTTAVEVRVTAGDAELWLDRVVFVPLPPRPPDPT
jgi:uncharacterized membrane protein